MQYQVRQFGFRLFYSLFTTFGGNNRIAILGQKLDQNVPLSRRIVNNEDFLNGHFDSSLDYFWIFSARQACEGA